MPVVYAIIQKHNPVAILTDYGMPEVDGFELVRMIREDNTTKGTPVVIITGHDSRASHEALMLSGAREILQKPVMPDRMGELLRSLGLPVREGGRGVSADGGETQGRQQQGVEAPQCQTDTKGD